VTLYLDTSSLVKLYVTEAGSDVVRHLVREAAIVATSTVAYAETVAALARLRREGRLSATHMRSAKRDFEAQWAMYLRIDATDALCRTAGEFAEKYALRGLDSIHLASFSSVATRASVAQTRFSSFDVRLNAAAKSLSRALLRSSRH
jgi:predicted nucleic acid-binding protein